MEKERRRPRVFFGWYIVAGSVFANTVLSAAYFQGLTAFILPIESHFGWNRSVISGAMSLRQLESGIVSPLIGFLLDRVKPRTLLFWSAILVGFGLIGLGRITGITTFYVAIVIISIGASGMSHAVTWPVIIARWFHRKRGIATGIAVMGPIFGSPFVIVNTSLEDTIGWRNLLVGWGIIVLVLLTLVSAIARERPQDYGLLPDGDPPDAEEEAGRVRRGAMSERGLVLGQAVRTKEFWLLTAYFAGLFIVNSAFQVHQIPYFVEDVGLTSTEAAVTFTLVFTLSGIGRIGAGYVLDKIDYRIVLATVSAMMAASFAYLQLVTITSVSMTLPFILLFGIGFGSVIPMRGTLGSMMFGTKSLGSIVGLLQGGSVAAGVVGPIFMGIIFDINGNYDIAIWAMILVSALMVPMAFVMSSVRILDARISTLSPR